MRRPVTRATPVLPVGAVQTYRVTSPLATHTRPASCAEVECAHWLHGWVTRVDERTDLGIGQAAYIRAECRAEHVALALGTANGRRRYIERRTPEGLTEFAFQAGQVCFAHTSHRVPLERPEIYLVYGGDWRARTGLMRRHQRPADWVEDFSEHQDRIVTIQQRG